MNIYCPECEETFDATGEMETALVALAVLRAVGVTNAELADVQAQLDCRSVDEVKVILRRWLDNAPDMKAAAEFWQRPDVGPVTVTAKGRRR